MEIRVEEVDGRGAVSGWEEGTRVGFITFTRRPPGTLLLDYVRTLPGNGGRGVGTRLVLDTARWVREQGLQLVPICGFARYVLDQHPEFDDIRADR